MKTRAILQCCYFLGLFLGISTLHGQPLRLEEPTATPGPGPSLVTRLDDPPEAPTPAPVQHGNIVADVQKMIESHTAENVIIAFIQNWSTVFSVSADEILHLHDIGASTDILTTLIQRSAQLQARANPPTPPGNPNALGPVYPEMAATNPPAMIYPYPTAPADTYSYLSPADTYSYLYPYSPPWLPEYAYPYPYYSFYYSWPIYRYHYWGGRPWYGHGYYPGHYPGHYYGGHPGFYGRGGSGYGHGGPGYGHGFSRGYGGFGRR